MTARLRIESFGCFHGKPAGGKHDRTLLEDLPDGSHYR